MRTNLLRVAFVSVLLGGGIVLGTFFNTTRDARNAGTGIALGGGIIWAVSRGLRYRERKRLEQLSRELDSGITTRLEYRRAWDLD